ncbi:MAG TPA: SusD/RagB family nutrient-binding outer membrane lipoprotein [Balneolaceae bacterium]
MKKLILPLFVSALIVTCEDLTEMNVDPKSPTQVEGNTLFTNAEKELVDFLASTDVNINVFKMYAQYWTETTYTDEARYDMTNRAIPDNDWSILYREVLKNLEEASQLIEANEDLDPGVKRNQLASIEVLKVLTFMHLVNIFGDIPYTEALDFENPQPAYDDDRTIYADLFVRLDSAISNFDAAAAGFGEADLFYGGDVASWIRFANAVKLRMGITIADVDDAAARAAIESAAANTFTSNADNTRMLYLDSPPNTNPIWVDLVQSGRQDFVAAETIIDAMNALEDPRRAEYFTLGPDGAAYVGGDYGASNTYSEFSHAGERVVDPAFPAIVIDYAEVEFILAEAVERGYNVGGTAEEHYNAAITASMEDWGVEPQAIATYLAQPSVAYATAEGDFRQKIGTQKWIALYLRGLQAWTEWRRLDYPVLNVPPGLTYEDIPLRFTYPVTEQNLNTAQWEQAANNIGGDEVSTPIFWDVN